MKATKAYGALLECCRYEVEARGRVFDDGREVKQCIWDVARALTSDKPYTALLLTGDCGNGKTTLAQALADLLMVLGAKRWAHKYCPEAGALEFRKVDARDFAKRACDWNAFRGLRDLPLVWLEDMGTEGAEVQSYGNILSPTADLLEYRYAEGLFTLVTTNLGFADIEPRYGRRLADRLNEAAVIAFKHKSFRK